MTVKYTELKNTRIVLRDAIPLAKPFTILIEPSSLCNFKCTMCFQSTEKKGRFAKTRGNMSLDTFEKTLEQIKVWGKVKVLKLAIFGEPFVNPLFGEMLRLAKEADIAERIETTSNASLLTPKLCEQLVAYGIDYVRVSIYGYNEQKHREVTTSSIPLSSIHDNLALLQKIKAQHGATKPFIAVKTLDTFHEESNLIFQELFKDVADETYIDKPHNWVQPHGENFIEKLYHKEVQTENTAQFACPMPFTTLAIRSNGDVAPCCIDWFGATIIGNMHDIPVTELWNGTKHRALMRMQLANEKHKNVSCASCEVFKNGHYTKDNIDGVNPDSI